MPTFPSGLFSDLPNIHSVLVHFPLALAPAAVLFDLVLLVRPRAGWTDRGAAFLYVLAAAGALAAARAGQAAEAALGPLAPAARRLLNAHERLATRALWLLAVLAVLRLFAAWRDRRTGVVPRGLLRIVLLAAGLAAVALLATVADLGGRMVYRHGIGVAAPPAVEGR